MSAHPRAGLFALVLCACAPTIDLGVRDGGVDAPTPPTCEPPQTTCGAACADLARDPSHCGACDVACEAAGCAEGRCCPEGHAACDGPEGAFCADLANDLAHCGACGQACRGFCVRGACCDGAAPGFCDGVCLDLARDAAHCGACDQACAPGERCAGGGCCVPDFGGACLPASLRIERAPAGREALLPMFADLDADGRDDGIWPLQLQNAVVVAWGGRHGLSELVTLPTGRTGADNAAGDVDGDGIVDLLVPVQSGPPLSDQLALVRGRAGRTFAPVERVPFPGNAGPLALLDGDGDGTLDLAAGLLGRGCVALAHGRGDGSFDAARCIDTVSSGESTQRLETLDVDDDGRDELLELRGGVGLVVHWLDGAGGIRESETLPPCPVTAPNAWFDVTDVDGDGARDLVQFDAGTTETLVALLRHEGPGWWRAEPRLVTLTRAVADPTRHEGVGAVGDFDGDGLFDLLGTVTCAYCTSVLTLHLGAPAP